MPYASFQGAKYDALKGQWSHVYSAGINCLINGHKSKFTLDWQNRPTFAVAPANPFNSNIVKGKRLNQVVLQYQIFF